jgi:molybdopterin/thiamine biosynthesis adenylyltransferase
MALALFLDKITQSASSLLAGFDPSAFTARLAVQRIALALDPGAAASAEGRATAELALDLLARLYPRIDVIPLGAADELESFVRRLLETARRINPVIEGGTSFESGTAAALVVGAAPAPWDTSQTPSVYIGSDGWLAKVSSEYPVRSGATANPFGAGAAACLGAANVFRAIFGAQLRHGELDRHVTISLIDYELASANLSNPPIPDVLDLGETFLVGVGAIGHGAVWAWRHTAGLLGTLHLVDHESYDDTNPQRYVDVYPAGMPALKVEHAAALLRNGVSGGLNALPHPHAWDEYLKERGDWNLQRVALALDSAEDRILAQCSLPRRIFNSWTQADNLGVSRHDFLTTACVACLYLPGSERPDLDDLIAGALKFQGEQELRLVREYLDTERPLDRALLAKIAQQVGVAEHVLLPLEGAPLIALYHRAACGGTILRFGGQLGAEARDVEVPMAFQSALAGLMLAAEVVIDAAALRLDRLPVRTEVNLLRPLSGTLCTPESKHLSRRCICQDADFISAYRAKYDAIATSL